MTEKLNIDQEYNQNEKEGQQVTLYKSNSGGSGEIKVCAFNKLLWWQTGNHIEIRYRSYTNR